MNKAKWELRLRKLQRWWYGTELFKIWIKISSVASVPYYMIKFNFDYDRFHVYINEKTKQQRWELRKQKERNIALEEELQIKRRINDNLEKLNRELKKCKSLEDVLKLFTHIEKQTDDPVVRDAVRQIKESLQHGEENEQRNTTDSSKSA